VKSRLLISALEEAYRNRIMVGKFPACVLHLRLQPNAVDVNVHPAKTEVKFLNEKAVFDCVHYGVLGALNKTSDRPQMQFKPQPTPVPTPAAAPTLPPKAAPQKQESFFRTMTPAEFKNFTAVLKDAPQPSREAAAATVRAMEKTASLPLRETVSLPSLPEKQPAPVPQPVAVPAPAPQPEPEQTQLPMPPEIPWRLVGELYRSYVIVEQGEDAFLIDKHAAHERILFEKLKANQEAISSQLLLKPVPCRLSPESCAQLLQEKKLLEELGFEVEEFGDSTLLLRQIPMDLTADEAPDTLEAIAADLLSGRREDKTSVRDEILHTVACKAAIKAGWKNDEQELLALVRQVMANEDLKYCPHGRPICISLSKKQLEKQFKRA
jgi:DNA mismatch repair protein MutL